MRVFRVAADGPAPPVLPTRFKKRRPRSYVEWKVLRRWGRLPVWEDSPPGYVLRGAREECGVSQAELGQRLGCTQQAIAQAEQADSNPTIRFVRAWARALGKELTLELREPALSP